MRRRDVLLGAGAAMIAGQARAEGFPDRTITITNGYGPGGSTDVAARLLMEQMIPALGAGTRMIVENRAGASGTVASAWMVRQPADGYALMISESSSFAIWPAMHEGGTKYRPLEDFTWIATVCTAPMVFIVSQDFPAKDAKEAFAVLKSDASEKLDYSSSGAGSIPHIGAEMLKIVLGGKSHHIPYRGGAEAVLSIAKGETKWGVASLGSAAGQINGKLVRALAMTSPERFPSFSDVPAFAEVGLKEMEMEILYMVHGPAGIPRDVTERLNKAAVASLANSQTQDKFIIAGMRAWKGANTPETARAAVDTELKRFKAVGERTGIKITG